MGNDDPCPARNKRCQRRFHGHFSGVIHRTRGLIHQDHRWLTQHCSRQRHAPTLAARKRVSALRDCHIKPLWVPIDELKQIRLLRRLQHIAIGCVRVRDDNVVSQRAMKQR